MQIVSASGKKPLLRLLLFDLLSYEGEAQERGTIYAWIMHTIKDKCIAVDGIRIGTAHDFSGGAVTACIATAGIVGYDNHVAAHVNASQNSRDIIMVEIT